MSGERGRSRVREQGIVIIDQGGGRGGESLGIWENFTDLDKFLSN